MGCPQCGKILTLQALEVKDDGTLGHAILCPDKGCGWGDMIKLMGWEPLVEPE